MGEVIITVVASYLLASIPFGYILFRLLRGSDIRQRGSGNIGTTNILRVAGKQIAFFTLLFDVTKAFIPVFLVSKFYQQANNADSMLFLTCIAVITGHIFPVWLKFKGGKGVASFVGVLLALNWISFICFAVIWLAIFLSTRYASLASIIAIVVSIIIYGIALAHNKQIFMALLLIGALITVKHRSNIERLLQGTENKFSNRK